MDQVTRPAGVPPDALPPDFDGWDKEPSVPTHPLGTVTAIDHDSGLPIVKRKTAQSEPKPEDKSSAKPEEKPEPKPEPVEERSLPATPVVESKPQNTLHKPAADEKKYKFGNTQVNLPASSDAHKAITSMQAKIPQEHQSDVHEDQDAPHVTVRYGLKDGDTGKLKDYLSKQPPFQAKLGKTMAFPVSEHSEGAAPIVASVESPELHRMNSEIQKHGDFAPSSFPDYKPHVTVAYVKPEHAAKYTGMTDGEGKSFTVGSVAVGDRDGNHEEVKLSGKAPLNAAGPVRASALAKDTPVRLPDGTTGKLAFSDGVNARVRTDDGRNVNAKHKDITPMNEVKVKAHTRMVPARNDQ